MNLFEYIAIHRCDEFFDEDVLHDQYVPTKAIAGSMEKIEIMRLRLEYGCPLQHAGDSRDIQLRGSTAQVEADFTSNRRAIRKLLIETRSEAIIQARIARAARVALAASRKRRRGGSFK
jgi:hypothetical protein